MRRIRTLMLVAGLVVVVTARAGDGAGPQPGGDVFTAIVGTILAGPVPAVHGTDGRHHVVYELVLTNTKAVPATLQAVEVLNRANDARLARFEGNQLLGMLRAMNARPAASLDLPANESRVVLLSLAFSSAETVPRLLDHRLDALAAISPAATAPSPISYRLAPLEVPARAAPVLRPPLEGKAGSSSTVVVTGPGRIAAPFCPSMAGSTTLSGSPSISSKPTPRAGWWWAMPRTCGAGSAMARSSAPPRPAASSPRATICPIRSPALYPTRTRSPWTTSTAISWCSITEGGSTRSTRTFSRRASRSSAATGSRPVRSSDGSATPETPRARICTFTSWPARLHWDRMACLSCSVPSILPPSSRSEEHTSELQSPMYLV